MMPAMKQNGIFTLLNKDSRSPARRGRLKLPHGTVETPAFMPVATQGVLKAMTPLQLEETGARVVLGNTYHLAWRPGEKLIRKFGGLHKFSGWDGPMLTDSGGFQVFSVKYRTIDEEGVTFRYASDGESEFFSPERSIQIQRDLGADIAMAFDECIPSPCTHDYARQSTQRTLRWAKRCLTAHSKGDDDRSQFLFGIVQGSVFKDLRRDCALAIADMPFDGIAVGGVSVGEGLDLLKKVVEFTEPHLPKKHVRYLMGVGFPEDLLESVERGMDIFDCVIPSRMARSGTLFTPQGRIRVTNNKYRKDSYPVDTACDCYTCSRFSRAFLRHAIMSKEVLGSTLCTIHNMHYYQKLMADMRSALDAGRFGQFKAEALDRLAERDKR